MPVKRLPEVLSLTSVLPKGVEGGKEFARIVDLLLFHDAKRSGKKITIFNDNAGDYIGLDSFEGDQYRIDGHIGYQYKFFASPLSAAHRKEIANSLSKAKEKHSKAKRKISKWILITPDDLVESSLKRDGGDITWFENLKAELKISFEIEHWGHKKLLALFLETPSLCLFYYPELVPDGAKQKRSIIDTRKRYDDNLIDLYKNIEFVGMSIYKPEATKGVPMEHIYIPLSLIQESADENNVKIKSFNPVQFLKYGMNTVILGDPGSGKSTILRFLTLCGISRQLQKKFKFKRDNRLPILVTLRRYADELKSRKNLSILDYIQEVIKADFSLSSANEEFFEFYLENGQCVLLFDGLDELPDPKFKQTVRNRIRSLITTYPGNCVIVTSRIVGYDNPFRFDEKEFSHYKVRKLQFTEMEQFVNDWYCARVESDVDRKANVEDLVRILNDETNTAIRELAENPLLLTIVALVHRIDAVLPDERVVLYQKCTETLLNTWYTWKFRDAEIKSRGKVERRNRHRMESIAYWMQTRSVGTGKGQRSVVPFKELLDFLTAYVTDVEKLIDQENDPVDVALDFLDFIKTRAGLLIEVGDEMYSFIHLTFQEYLASAYLITISEKDGVKSIWNEIDMHSKDPRWFEVIRLLVAGLKSNDSQEFLIDNLLPSTTQVKVAPALLGGLLLDGVYSAELRSSDIVYNLMYNVVDSGKMEDIRYLNGVLKILCAKDGSNEKLINEALLKIWTESSEHNDQLKIALLSVAIGIEHAQVKSFMKSDDLLSLFFVQNTRKNKRLQSSFDKLYETQKRLSIVSSGDNLFASVLQFIPFLYDKKFAVETLFEQLILCISMSMDGPDMDFTHNLILINTSENVESRYLTTLLLDNIKNDRQDFRNRRSRGRMQFNILTKRGVDLSYYAELQKDRALREKKTISHAGMARLSRSDFWQQLYTTHYAYSSLIENIIESFSIKSSDLWTEALRVGFMPSIPTHFSLFNESEIERVRILIKQNKRNAYAEYFTSCIILVDVWLTRYVTKYKTEENTPFRDLITLAENSKTPVIQFSLFLRKLLMNDVTAIEKIVEMLKSDDPSKKELFKRIHWGLNEKDRKNSKD